MSINVPDAETIDELTDKQNLKEMRTDWLLLEKERLERKDSINAAVGRDIDIDVITAELKRRSPHDRQEDNAYAGVFPSGTR